MVICGYSFGVCMVAEAKVVKRATVPVSLPISVVKKIEELRGRLGYRSRNAVIREAIRRFIEDVEEAKLLYVRDVTLKQAKRKIIEYLKRHGSAYVSEMAESLGVNIELAFKAVEELEKEGVVGE
jgi:metal-responsive CopG/Arc/MetJ family transcriptional regulator